MSGRHFRSKAARTELSIVNTLQSHGIAAHTRAAVRRLRWSLRRRYPESCLGRSVEVKAGAKGFRELYAACRHRNCHGRDRNE
jgi:hypothetical protein